MNCQDEHRQEGRLGHQCLVWFGEDFAETMNQGLMVDISSRGIAFDCPADGVQPRAGECLTIRFSVPQFDGEDSMAEVSITRIGRVRRADNRASGICRVAVEFDTPLTLRPTDMTALSSACRRNP